MILNKIYNKDARDISKIIKKEIIDVTITSPPYFDLKDYGYSGQIGFGQEYDSYLNDLYKVFQGVFEKTKNAGTLWVIIDSYRRDDEVVNLPFDFSNRIKDIGWKLQEVIIWEKDKTLPWAHKGQMRNIFEYILVFSKSKEYTFMIDKVRDFENLKKWWVRYPERYNPKGKTPTGIWNFEIPTQGSWGKSYKSHFCPLPEKMIEQILKITTNENDVVFDPFSGSGTVPSVAAFMKRKYTGFELNKEYIKMFDEYLKEFKETRTNQYTKEKKHTIGQHKFEKLIINLRCLKLPRLLIPELKKNNNEDIITVFVEKSKKDTDNLKALIKVNYFILIKKDSDKKLLLESIKYSYKNTTLSNFGIEPEFILIDDEELFIKKIKNKTLYSYTLKVTHCYKNIVDINNYYQYPIISEIKLELIESDYA